jgi:hypothetical protein
MKYQIKHLANPPKCTSPLTMIAIYAGSGLVMFAIIAAVYHLTK